MEWAYNILHACERFRETVDDVVSDGHCSKFYRIFVEELALASVGCVFLPARCTVFTIPFSPGKDPVVVEAAMASIAESLKISTEQDRFDIEEAERLKEEEEKAESTPTIPTEGTFAIPYPRGPHSACSADRDDN